MENLIAPIFNFTVLVVLLVYFLKQPLRDHVSDRHTTLRDEVQGVESLLQRARERYDEFSAKLKAIDAESAAIREQVRQDAESARLRVMSDAKRLSGVIVADARASAESIVHDFRDQLRVEFSNRVIDRAETILKGRLTGAEQARIRKDFSRKVEAMQ